MLDNVAQGTRLAWYFPTDLLTTAVIYRKGDFPDGWSSMGTSKSSGHLVNSIRRNTTNSQAESSSVVSVINQWNCMGCIWDINGVDADQKLYWGDLDTQLAEVAGYTVQVAGSGAIDSEATYDLLIGQNSNNGTWGPFHGRIGIVAEFDRVLALWELQQWQYSPQALAGIQHLAFLGIGGTGPQPDWSGNGNTGTVTGAAQADPPPLPVPMGLITGFSRTMATLWS